MTDTPIIVNPDPIVGQLATALRYVLTTAGGYAIAKGWITGGALEVITSIALVLVPLVYGVWKSRANKSDLVTVARAAPDNVAIVRGPVS